VQIRRCSILLIEPREKVVFDLDSLLTGGNGLSAHIELLALAPHLPKELVIDAAEAEALSAIGATSWIAFADLAEKFDTALLHTLIEKGLLTTDDEIHAATRTRDEQLRTANWHAHSAVAGRYLGRVHRSGSLPNLGRTGRTPGALAATRA